MEALPWPLGGQGHLACLDSGQESFGHTAPGSLHPCLAGEGIVLEWVIDPLGVKNDSLCYRNINVLRVPDPAGDPRLWTRDSEPVSPHSRNMKTINEQKTTLSRAQKGQRLYLKLGSLWLL